jgi:hypothetical protein
MAGLLDPEAWAEAGRRAKGLLSKYFEDAKGVVEHPRKVYEGTADPYDPGMALGLAGMAMTGGIGGAPAGAIGSGPIRAYHGSPHDFDKFSLDKIGTGEGAQAYGHGLYFAENEGVAKSYRDALTRNIDINQTPFMRNGQRVGSTGNKEVDDMLLSYDARGGTIDDVISTIRYFTNDPNKRNAKRYQEMLPIAERAKADGYTVGTDPGRMYEVQINADPDRFLDWDKPLSEQSEAVQGIFQQLDAPMPPKEMLSAFLDTDYAKSFPDASDVKIAARIAASGDPEDIADWAARQAGTGSSAHNLLGGGNASQAYERLARRSGGQTAATDTLRQAGIPGIKYLDQGSRAAGDGSRNYVVFDDSIVEIVKKYGIAGLALLPPAVLMANGIDPASVGQEQ